MAFLGKPVLMANRSLWGNTATGEATAQRPKAKSRGRV